MESLLTHSVLTAIHSLESRFFEIWHELESLAISPQTAYQLLEQTEENLQNLIQDITLQFSVLPTIVQEALIHMEQEIQNHCQWIQEHFLDHQQFQEKHESFRASTAYQNNTLLFEN
jgi:hypothetical protein